ncbi:SubName: Full=Probable endopeptidase K {ECO:0000313/EMBL:CCA73645.1} [Serendipita indica DSM 11827]|nr:SubName: Full=Probable endopeptidase K {ECO:0000313/EMBL:CCA73645.1} [Serendipita indica DSM 11827]
MIFAFISALLFAVEAVNSAPVPPKLAPLYRRSSSNSTRYIVALHENTVNPTQRLDWLNRVLATTTPRISAQSTSDANGAIHHWDAGVFNGLAGTFDSESVNVLRAQSEVAWIEEDAVLHKSASPLISQLNAPWGLSRLSSDTPLDVPARFDPRNTSFTYTFPSSAGKGVDIYILDSGIRTTHLDYNGRAEFLATFSDGAPGQDRDGHGSHVAGTAAGRAFGVAKAANLFAVKVLDDSGAGPISAIISGLNLVAKRASGQNTTSTTNSTTQAQSVVSPPTLDRRVTANVNNFTLLNQLPNSANVSSPVVRGVVVVIAAGNDGVEVGDASPADVPEAITVGAMDVNDNVPSFSNFGSQVAVFAPGAAILSCGITSDNATAVLSGTSMATPHITGLSAVLLGEDPTLSPAQVKAKIQSLAIQGALGTGFKVGSGTKNLLANLRV